MQEIIIIIILGLLVWYWWDSSYSSSVALQHCLRLCQSTGVQLLDSTVNLQRSWLRRAPTGGIQICRLYSFAYSGDQESRQYGYIVLLGHEVAEQHIEQTIN